LRLSRLKNSRRTRFFRGVSSGRRVAPAITSATLDDAVTRGHHQLLP
jgi:hypothetical protein